VTGVFRANNPFNTFMLFVYGLLLKLVWFISPQVPAIQNSDNFLYNSILATLKPYFDPYPVVYSLILFFLVYTQAISFNALMNNRRMMPKPNYLPGMSYLLITSFFPDWNILSSSVVINTFIIWVWAQMSTLYNNQQIKGTLFNIGLMIGLSTFFYYPALAFSVLIIAGLLITRPPRVAEWLIPLLGILTPWYFLFAWLFLTNRLYGFNVPGIAIDYPIVERNINIFIGLGLIILATAIGLYFVQKNATRQVVQVRKSWGLMMLYLIVALFIPFINMSYNFNYWFIATVPLSAFIANTFWYPRKKVLPLMLHWGMVAFVIYMNLLT
jgi:hypothetical protein